MSNAMDCCPESHLLFLVAMQMDSSAKREARRNQEHGCGGLERGVAGCSVNSCRTTNMIQRSWNRAVEDHQMNSLKHYANGEGRAATALGVDGTARLSADLLDRMMGAASQTNTRAEETEWL